MIKKFSEWLRAHSERDPFARQSIVGKPIAAKGKTCDWCGNEGKGGKLYQYTVENDDGRNSVTKGLFCCKSCFKSYHG